MVMTIDERTVYSAITERPGFSWPGGAGLAVWLAVNTEHYEFIAPSPQAWPRVPQPDVQGYASREFGSRVGFWRVAELLDSLGAPVTASLNLGILERIPEIRKALVERDWAIMSHGTFNTRNIIGLSDEEERAFYAWSVGCVKNLTGRDLKGMLTPGISANYETPDLMAEAGLTYHADWVNDDQPVPVRVAGGQKFVTVPYTFELNTGALFGRHFDAEYYLETAKAQFDVLLADSAAAPRVMCLSMHPYAIGAPHAIGYLAELLGYMREAAGVWWTTGDDIAQHYLDNVYDTQVAYEDSLAAGKEG